PAPVSLLDRLEELAHNLMKLLTVCASPERVAAERSRIRRSSSRCATISAAALPRSTAPAADPPQPADLPRHVQTRRRDFRGRPSPCATYATASSTILRSIRRIWSA